MTNKQIELAIKYYQRGLSLRDVGKVLGVSGQGVLYHFKRRGISTRPPGALRKSLEIDTKKLRKELGTENDRVREGELRET